MVETEPEPPPLFAALSDAERAARKRRFLAGLPTARDLWVFGYGSLMWKTEFAFQECRPATVMGHHRAFCVWSHRYRGTPDEPGLVLGLDRGGVCVGRAFRVKHGAIPEVTDYLWKREMVTGIYNPTLLDAVTPTGPIRALAFVVDPSHRQYAGGLSPDSAARRIRAARGRMGPNRDYLFNTLAHLDELSVRDPLLHGLADRVKALDCP